MKRARRKRALPPFVIEDVAANGQVRLYYRGPALRRQERQRDAEEDKRPRKIRIWPSVEQEGFWAAYEAAKRGEQLPKPVKVKTTPVDKVPVEQTFSGLCQSFYRSAKFQGLAPGTAVQWKRNLELCCKEPLGASPQLQKFKMGGCPIAVFGPAHIKWLMDCRAGMPEAANNRLKAVRALFAWHLEGTEKRNPCEGVKKLSPNNADGFHTWTVDEDEKYERKHPIGTNARLAFDLARFTTQRKSDVARLGPQHVFMRDGVAWIRLRQEKTKRKSPTRGLVEIPIIEPLAVSIAARPVVVPKREDAEAFLMTSFGKPYTANGLGNAFRGWCDEAGLPHCSMHGLRKATASMFAELGVNEEGIGAVTGHASGSKSLSIYTRGARRTLLAGRAFEALQKELTKRANERSDQGEFSEFRSQFISEASKTGT